MVPTSAFSFVISTGLVGAAVAALEGHMKNMFHLPNRQGLVDVREERDMPSAAEFARLYQNKWGKPVLFKGAAKKMRAMRTFTDDAYMAAHFADETLGMVEFAKKETRTAGGGSMRVGEFLRRYRTDDLYSVSALPPVMAADVDILPFLACSYATQFLDISNIWWSSGGTKSVIHNDDQDNINCLFEGRKRMIFWHPSDKEKIESDVCGWVDAEVERETNPSFSAYGAFGGKIDVDKVDLETFPTWGTLKWWDAPMEAGDCLFIPTAWYHHVLSEGRNIAAHVWWWRDDTTTAADFEQCPAEPLTLKDCTWGYEGSGQRQRMTKCKGKTTDLRRAEPRSFITDWQLKRVPLVYGGSMNDRPYMGGKPGGGVKQDEEDQGREREKYDGGDERRSNEDADDDDEELARHEEL